MMYSGVASADAYGYGYPLNQSTKFAPCEISCGIFPSSRWNLLMNSSAVRVFAKSPSAFSANDVQNESRPKYHANPGRWLSPDVRYPATNPVPKNGFVTIPCSTLTRAQSYAFCSRSSGSSTLTV